MACLHRAIACLSLLAAGLHGPAAAEGLTLTETAQRTWRARLTLGLQDSTLPPRAVSLVGDYYFGTTPGLRGRTTGGLRASSGIVLGAGSALLAAAAATAPAGELAMPAIGRSANLRSWMPETTDSAAAVLPYVGIGYTHHSADGEWGLNADFGLVATQPQFLGHALLGPHRLDEAMRNLRLRPVLQLGVRYSF
jgi:hypothetical protein